MKKIFSVFSLCLTIGFFLVACGKDVENIDLTQTISTLKTSAIETEKPQVTTKDLYFDPSINEVIYEEAGDRPVFDTLKELEEHYMVEEIYKDDNIGFKTAFIVEGHLVGPGKQVQPGFFSRVITHFQVTKIHYLGSKTHIKEGEQILVCEPYYFVTKSTSESLGYKEGTIIAEEYYPMERNKKYIIFGEYFPGKETHALPEFHDPVLIIAEPAYCLDDDAPIEGINRVGYRKIWPEVKEKYGKN